MTGWVDKTSNANANMLTSWVSDLMVAGQINNYAIRLGHASPPKLWFNGAGNLGVQLKLGINTSYVSQNNQDKVNGKDKVLGVVPMQADANNPVPNAGAYNAKQWSLANADALAAKLRNPTVDSAYTGKSANSGGENQQDQALKDFLSIFASTQAKGTDANNPNGYWDDLNITNANADVIRKALFGDGTTAGGLIDSQNILVGGALPLGAAMAAESLGKYMGNIAGVNYAAWVEPLQKALTKYKITTPQRIAAFFAQVKLETAGLRDFIEKLDLYTVNNLLNTSLWGSRFAVPAIDWETGQPVINQDTGLPAINPVTGTALTWAQFLGRKAGDGVLPEWKSKWIADIGYEGKNGNIPKTSDGWNFRGRGPFHLTGRGNYKPFAVKNFGLGSPEFFQIMNNPDSMNTNLDMLALTATSYWDDRKMSVGADKLDESDTNPPAMTPDGKKYLGGNLYTDRISRPIATDQGSYPSRWNQWQSSNIKFAYAKANPYENINAALNGVGFKVTQSEGYEKQFGLTLRSRQLVPIAPSPGLLQTQEEIAVRSESVIFGMSDSLIDLVQAAQESLGLTTEVVNMYLYDLPAPNQAVEQVMVMAKSQVLSTKNVLGICHTVFANRNYDENQINFDSVIDANSYFGIKGGHFKFTKPTVTIIQQPKRGQLIEIDGESFSGHSWKYVTQLWVGKDVKDSIIVEVKQGATRVRLHYFIKITDDMYTPTCQGAARIISKSSVTDANVTNDLAAWTRTAQLSALLASASQSLTDFTDLPGTAVGQNVGEGAAASITLDTNAAGHGWYIDPTPLDPSTSSGLANANYLPTSNPNIWQAKAGSDAAGKMDMLSVLLHEYGHALGLEHSAQLGDFMNTSLQTGQRRLPSSEELALMG